MILILSPAMPFRACTCSSVAAVLLLLLLFLLRMPPLRAGADNLLRRRICLVGARGCKQLVGQVVRYNCSTIAPEVYSMRPSMAAEMGGTEDIRGTCKRGGEPVTRKSTAKAC